MSAAERTTRILYVDGDEASAAHTAACLEREADSFEVVTADSVRDGLDRIETERVDCVVSEYDLPDRTGLEFLETVRERYGELPFVIFTGHGSEAVASEAIGAGVTDYLQQSNEPGRDAVLANRVAAAVDEYRSRSEDESSEERLSLLVDESPMGVIEWDGEMRVVQMNPAAEDILGYSEAELVGKQWTEIVPPSDRAPVADVIAEIMETGTKARNVNENVRGDGERITCEWHNRVVTDDDGSVVTMFSLPGGHGATAPRGRCRTAPRDGPIADESRDAPGRRRDDRPGRPRHPRHPGQLRPPPGGKGRPPRTGRVDRRGQGGGRSPSDVRARERTRLAGLRIR